MIVLETHRLILRRFEAGDAPFILDLLNDPDWLLHIGDKGLRTLEDARAYIENVPVAMYGRFGFGLYLVELKEEGIPVGMCGLIKREALEDVDIGFAFLPEFRGKGYASEAVAATLEYGKHVAGLDRIVAIVSPGNHASVRLLEKLGFTFERTLQLADNDEVHLFAEGTRAQSCPPHA